MNPYPVYIGGGAGNQSIVLLSPSTVNTLSSWISFGTTLFPADTIIIVFDCTLANTIQNSLINIGIGPSGSQAVLIPNLPIMGQSGSNGYSPSFTVTLRVPRMAAGTQIWGQIQSTYAGFAPRVSLAYQHSGISASALYNLGAVTSSSSGTQVSTGSGAYGAWVSMGTLPVPKKHLVYASSRDVSSLNTINIGIGPSGSVTPILFNLPIILDSLLFPIDADFPPGEYWIQAQGSEVATLYADLIFS